MASMGGSWSPRSHFTWGLWESCSPEVPLCVALWWPSCPLCSVCRPVGEVKLRGLSLSPPAAAVPGSGSLLRPGWAAASGPFPWL